MTSQSRLCRFERQRRRASFRPYLLGCPNAELVLALGCGFVAAAMVCFALPCDRIRKRLANKGRACRFQTRCGAIDLADQVFIKCDSSAHVHLREFERITSKSLK